MVQYEGRLDSTLGALADPTRRGILERLGRESATITELAQPLGMSLTGVKKHVHVLEAAELVRSRKEGRVRRCCLGTRRLEELERWIEAYRELLDGRLDRLGELLEGEQPRLHGKQRQR